MIGLEAFKQVVAKSTDIPKDLQLLFEATDSGDDSPFNAIGLTCLLPDQENEINDISYLSEEDLKNPDIQCNIQAINHVAKMARFVAIDDERNLYGYWLGTGSKTLSAASILKFDNEGQFEMLPGSTLAEAVSGHYAAGDDDNFATLKAQFAQIGIVFSAKDCDGLYDLSPADVNEPKTIHHEVYNSERIKRGLAPM
jgi:hypothetical protein